MYDNDKRPETYSRLLQVEKEVAVVHNSVKTLGDYLNQTNQSLKELTDTLRVHVIETTHKQDSRIILLERELTHVKSSVDEIRESLADMDKRQKEYDKARAQFGAVMVVIGFLGTSAGGVIIKLFGGG